MTPIVFLTGQGGCDLDLEAMSKGAADWLTKGELSATLLDRSIRHAMERQRKRAELIKAKRVIQALSECNDAVIHIKDEVESAARGLSHCGGCGWLQDGMGGICRRGSGSKGHTCC